MNKIRREKLGSKGEGKGTKTVKRLGENGISDHF